MKISGKKTIRLIVGIAIGAGLLSQSVYFEPLENIRSEEMKAQFKPGELVDYFIENEMDSLLEAQALPLTTFDSLLLLHPKTLEEKHGKSIGISSESNFLVKGNTPIEEQTAEGFRLITNTEYDYVLNTKYIFSNTARDALDYFQMSDFSNTMDFNAISSKLNSYIQQEVLAPEKLNDFGTNTNIIFYGAITVNPNKPAEEIGIVPLRIFSGKEGIADE